MEGAFSSISGSAGPSCSLEKPSRTIDFVQSFLVEGLRLGGGLVALASDESATLGPQVRPRIFDWIVLRGVERYINTTTEPPRTLVKLVMSD